MRQGEQFVLDDHQSVHHDRPGDFDDHESVRHDPDPDVDAVGPDVGDRLPHQRRGVGGRRPIRC